MVSEEADVHKVYWSDKHIGDVRNPRWSDFPWLTGDFTPGTIDGRLVAVLEWFAKLSESEDDDDLPEPPFPAELTDNWYIEMADGERREISVPIVDTKNGTITWR